MNASLRFRLVFKRMKKDWKDKVTFCRDYIGNTFIAYLGGDGEMSLKMKKR